MKKLLSTVLILTMCLCLGLVFTGCGGGQPYANYDLSEYIKLPDYDAYQTKAPDVKITDENTDEEITKQLTAKATTEKITEGTVAKGDTVTVSFKGTLKDGSSPSGMNSEGSSVALGSGTMIKGFEEGLYGATIGKEVTLNLKFPDPYQVNPDLSGKDVTFAVTVLSKDVKKVPELDEAFVKENSEYKTVAEYRAAVAKDLEQKEYDNQLYAIKSELYSKLVTDTEVLKYPEKEVKAQIKEVDSTYRQQAEQSGAEWEDYRDNKLGVDQKEYEEQIELYARELVKQEMIIYAVAEKEGLSVAQEEYDEYLDSMLKSSGFKDEDAFKDYTGMSLKKYAEKYKLDRDLLLTKELDTIYDRLMGK